MKHISVLLEPTIESLDIKEDGVYVDCTLGYAGHSSAILKRLKKGKLYAFDQDEIARKHSEGNYHITEYRIGSFGNYRMNWSKKDIRENHLNK